MLRNFTPRSVKALLVALFFTPALWASQESSGQTEIRRMIPALVERWNWEGFWDGVIMNTRLKSSSRARVKLFGNTEIVGLCSLDLGSCMVYERNGDQLGQEIRQEQIRGTNLSFATENFMRGLNPPNLVSNTQEADGGTSETAKFRYEGSTFPVPTAHPGATAMVNTRNLVVCNMVKLSFAGLGVPRSVREKIIPDNVNRFEQWLKQRLSAGPEGSKQEYVIPYYSERDPLTYVLIKVNGVVDCVVIVAPEVDGAGWRLGGHFDAKESPDQVQRLQRLILLARMKTVFR